MTGPAQSEGDEAVDDPQLNLEPSDRDEPAPGIPQFTETAEDSADPRDPGAPTTDPASPAPG